MQRDTDIENLYSHLSPIQRDRLNAIQMRVRLELAKEYGDQPHEMLH